MASSNTFLSSSVESRKYKLSRELIGHTDEVIGLAIFKNGNIVSASKDNTARLWEHHNEIYTESVIMTGHKDAVCSVCVIEPTERNPTGFIITGSNDKNVCIYYPGEETPIHTIQAHDDVTCHLKASVFEPESFLSSSMDNTGKLWNLYNLKKPTTIFSGHVHNSIVWCINDMENGLVVTGASDKMVLIHARNGKVLYRLAGHSSCVTDITAISSTHFLTCSNDCKILLWNSLHGTCIEQYIGHNDHINSIAAIDGGKLTVSCGKDQTVRVWHMGIIKQTLVIPAKTAWNVKVLFNRDIICSSSDNIIRIFTTDENRYIDEKIMTNYMQKVREILVSVDNRDRLVADKYKKNILWEKELNEPGKKDKDTVIIRRNGKVKVYRWSEVNYQWYLVGDVLEDKTGISKKPMYNGIEYDYVFSVDIKKNAPLLKLPYNKGEDPYEAARRFLYDNDLEPMFLDEVANFIITNIQLKPIINDEVQRDNPFSTNKYISNTWSHDDQVNSSSIPRSYIPHVNYLKIEQGNINIIQDKLFEFNNKLAQKEENQSIAKEKLEFFIKLINPEYSSSYEEAMNILISLCNWPDDIVFPVLDIARLAVLQKRVNKMFCEKEILNTLKKHMQPNSIISNQMLTFRLLANLFSHESGEQYCLKSKDEILNLISQLSNVKNKHTEIAISTYILNLIVALNKAFDVIGKEQILKVTLKFFETLTENEAIFRILVGIGTLIIETRNVEIRKRYVQFIKNCRPILLALLKYVDESGSGKIPLKIYNVSKEIIKLLR